MDKWCRYCAHDHAMHTDELGPGCSIVLALITDQAEPIEGLLPEPDDGRFSLPSRMVCLLFRPCERGGCTGDPGAEDRAERVAEVTGYWRSKASAS